MRVNIEDVAKILKETKGDELRQLLKHIFSFPCNIDTFAQFFFSHACSNRVPAFHKHLYELLDSDSNDAFAAPRGHAKSTIAGLFYIAWLVVNQREAYIVYVSQSYSKTVQFLTPLRDEFKTNEWLNFVYGDLRPARGVGEDGRDREDCIDVNGIRVEAASFEKNIRGFKYKTMRPTLIICDDIEDDMRVLNPELRIKDSNKLNKIIIPALDIDGRFKFIGTILHIDSLLINKIKQYKGKIFRAVNEDGLLWADRFTQDKLDKIKKDIGSIPFEQEYMNNPVDTTHSLIKREWVEQCFRADISTEDLKTKKFDFICLGVDFAFSDRVSADNSAFVSLGKDGDFYYCFHCETHKGWSLQEQMSYIKDTLYPLYRYDTIALEENSIRGITKNIGDYNLPIKLFWTAAKDPAKNIVTDFKREAMPEARNTVGKINLIMRLGTAFENAQFIIPFKTEKDQAVAKKILNELTSYALAEGKLVESTVHPDIPIAMGLSLEVLSRYGKSSFFFG